MKTENKIVEATLHAATRLDRLADDPAHVLLAEDDADLRNLVAATLRLDGYHVIETSNGGEFLDSVADWMLYRWPFEQLDLILTDVRMPGLAGTDVVSSLRRSHWDTPVIFVTAFADAQLYRDARDLDVLSVVEKPFEIDVLRAVVSLTVPRRPAASDPHE